VRKIGSMLLLALPPSMFMLRLLGRGSAARNKRMTRWFAGCVRAGATREIPRTRGRMTVHCRQGEAWITHDGDPRDVFLRPSQSYAVDRTARMTLHAMRGDCVFELQIEE
jgi:hypothetical protein